MDLDEFRAFAEGIFVHQDQSIKGSYVWLPYGVDLRNNVFSRIIEIVRNSGFGLYQFPLIEPIELLRRQKKLMSFEGGVLYITRFGNKELTEPYYLRPDGVTQASEYSKAWIKTQADLPLRLSNWGQFFRTENTNYPMVAYNGATMLEGYSFFSDSADAEAELDRMVSAIKRAVDLLGIPTLAVEMDPDANNPVSLRLVGFNVFVPSIGRTMQAAVAYYHGKKYSELFDISYINNGTKKLVEMCSFGATERLLGLVLMLCGDKKGFIIPPHLAAVKVAIVPVFSSRSDDRSINATVERVVRELEKAGLEYVLDMQKTKYLAKRFSKYEKMGIPIRIEFGPKELEAGKVSIVRRDTMERKEVMLDGLADALVSMLDDVDASLRRRLEAELQNAEVEVHSLEELRNSDVAKVKVIGYCGKAECRRRIEDCTAGEIIGRDLSNAKMKCISCGNDGSLSYVSRRF